MGKAIGIGMETGIVLSEKFVKALLVAIFHPYDQDLVRLERFVSHNSIYPEEHTGISKYVMLGNFKEK